MIQIKNIKSILLFCCLLLTVQYVFSQTDVSKKILGKWKFESEEKIILSTDIIRTDTLSKYTADSFFQKGIDMSFRDSLDIEFSVSHEGLSLVIPYTIEDSVLTIVKRSYRILQLDDKVLHFRVETDSVQTKYTYKKY
ncbi:hypothetical protein C8N46_102464 [Kordia periserrulae]|uniref:Lipocalin-like protein n=1 Tax=Kordia periserrulae TaxID=701523 RepID=A0A2T6C422_9FLAO|nr:hypothetical protein [Kordia periserrulae]PTX63062.1 hypothetical protein C8N46_102464 [Kordia periserrulae]